MSWVDDVDVGRDEAIAAQAPYAPCASSEVEPLSMAMRLTLALIFCLTSDLAFQTDAMELVRIDGHDVHWTALYQRTKPIPTLRASTSSPVR